MPKFSMRVGATIIMLLALVAAPGWSKAGAPPVAVWQTLPPTPALPTPDREGRVAVPGSTIWFGEWGMANPGTPVLLLHGGLANAAYWGHLIRALVAARRSVIAIDSREQGRSAASTSGYSYAVMASDTLAVLDRLGVRRVAIVGWSDGGTTGYQLALTAPERVARLFAFGANASTDGVRPGAAETPTFVAYLSRTQRECTVLAPDPRACPARFAAIERLWQTEPRFSAASLRAIEVPVTVALGEHDEAVLGDHARMIGRTIPHGRFHTLPGVSHFAPLQNPGLFDHAVLQFLNEDW